MPTIIMSDLDWFTAYSRVMAAALADESSEVGIDVGFEMSPSEIFTDFEISFPFEIPPACRVSFVGWSGPGGVLNLSAIAASSGYAAGTAFLTITGENTVALTKGGTFSFAVVTHLRNSL